MPHAENQNTAKSKSKTSKMGEPITNGEKQKSQFLEVTGAHSSQNSLLPLTHPSKAPHLVSGRFRRHQDLPGPPVRPKIHIHRPRPVHTHRPTPHTLPANPSIYHRPLPRQGRLAGRQGPERARQARAADQERDGRA